MAFYHIRCINSIFLKMAKNEVNKEGDLSPFGSYRNKRLEVDTYLIVWIFKIFEFSAGYRYHSQQQSCRY